MHYAISSQQASEEIVGTIRELAFIQATSNPNLASFHSKQGDYRIRDYVYKIGGKNKTRQQLRGVDNSFVVKDSILLTSNNTLPL